MLSAIVLFLIVFLAGMLAGVSAVQWHAKHSETINISGVTFQKVEPGFKK